MAGVRWQTHDPFASNEQLETPVQVGASIFSVIITFLKLELLSCRQLIIVTRTLFAKGFSLFFFLSGVCHTHLVLLSGTGGSTAINDRVMFHSAITPSKLIFSSLVLAGILASVHLAHAKRGCAAFGHSCFGGHGKRADTTINPSEVEELAVGLQPPADDARAFVVGDVPRTPAEIFNGDQMDNNELNFGLPPRYLEPANYVKLSPFFRKWLANSYRRGDIFGSNK